MKDIIVVDLDGTLANIDHRLHFIKREKPDWDGFFKACVNDTPNDWCVKLIQAMDIVTYEVWIVSARSRTVEPETRKWILNALGPTCTPFIEMLRAEGDYTPDDELKIKWLNESGLKDRILFVVDDRQRVVDMWRKEGLVCLQCYAWPEWKKP